MAENSKFFNLGDDKLVYDERKKRFVFLEDAPMYVDRAYRASMFKEVINRKDTIYILALLLY